MIRTTSLVCSRMRLTRNNSRLTNCFDFSMSSHVSRYQTLQISHFSLEGYPRCLSTCLKSIKAHKSRNKKPVISASSISQGITVAKLAQMLGLRLPFLLKKLNEFGYMCDNYKFILSSDDADIVVKELGYNVANETLLQPAELKKGSIPFDHQNWPRRPPVVTIMGHVNHGKTTLLDYLRKSTIAKNEAGGITQSIGAFTVELGKSQIVFLDTPGHAAFEAMRKRGALVTDIVILVVAADDGVKLQTKEALEHIREARQPFMVAITKCDKEGINIEKTKQSLGNEKIELEEYGGDIQCVEVSARTGQGMKDLEDAILSLADILEIRSSINGLCEGWIIESTVKNGLGIVASMLVKRGTLRIGTITLAGTALSKIKFIKDEQGNNLKSAGPGSVVQVVGWSVQPLAGSEFLEAKSLDFAKKVIKSRILAKNKKKEVSDIDEINRVRSLSSLDTKETIEKNANSFNLDVVVRGDNQGSIEALTNIISSIGLEQHRIRVISSSAGSPSESDIKLCTTFKSVIVAFNVEIPRKVRAMARDQNIDIIVGTIIYKVQDEIKKILSSKIPPLIQYKNLGEAQVLQVYPITVSKHLKKNIAGCLITQGSVKQGCTVRLERNSNIIWQGGIKKLKHLKKTVNQVNKSTECGIELDGFDKFIENDKLQFVEKTEIYRQVL